MRSSRRLTSVASASGAAPAAANALTHALLGQALAEARVGEHLVLDELAHAGRLVGERTLVELGEDRVARAGEQVGRDLAPALRDAGVVELAADQAQQRRLDLGVAQLRAAGDEAHDRLGDLLVDQRPARLAHGVQRLRAGHARQPHPVLRDRGHRPLQALEVREVVLAQRDQDAVVAAREVEALDDRFVVVERASSALGQPVLDQVGEVVDELRRALAADVVTLREREDLLELVEDQQRRQRIACVVHAARRRGGAGTPTAIRLRPRCRSASSVPEDVVAEDGLLDLLRRRR